MDPQPNETQDFEVPAAATLPPHIGRYRILELLGAGGMGKVYKAHDPQLDRVVAVKLPHMHGPPEDAQRRQERFQREARAAAQVWHSNVCPLHDVGEHDGQPFVVMAFIEGLSLFEVLRRHGPFKQAGRAVALVRQVLDGLEAVHARGIIHRDMKPGNIIIDPSGRAVLTDFGLARLFEVDERFTTEGVIIGTPAYMAPEQVSGEVARIGPTTDVYGTGVVLYQMLTGTLPFRGPGVAYLTQILHDAPPPLSQTRTDLPAGLEAVVLQALAKDPAQRFTSARAFADALAIFELAGGPATTPFAAFPATPSTVLEPETVGLSPLPSDPTKLEVASTFRRSKWWLTVLVAVWGLGTAWLMVLQLVWLAFEGGRYTPGLAALWSLDLAGWVTIFLVLQIGRANFFRRRHGPDALVKAAWAGDLELLERLIVLGFPLEYPDSAGETALQAAASQGNIAVARRLLSSGSTVNRRNHRGLTALDSALAHGSVDMVQLLKGAGARSSNELAAAGLEAKPNVQPPRPRLPFKTRWLLLQTLFLAAAVIFIYQVVEQWVNPGNHINLVEFHDLLKNDEVEELRFEGKRITGRVRDSHNWKVAHLPLKFGTFWTERPGNLDQFGVNQFLPPMRNQNLRPLQINASPGPAESPLILRSGILWLPLVFLPLFFLLRWLYGRFALVKG